MIDTIEVDKPRFKGITNRASIILGSNNNYNVVN